MKKVLLTGVAAFGLTFAAASAQAALHIDGGTSGIIPGVGAGSNEALAPLGFTNPLSGYYGSTIRADAGILTFTFLGFEAGADNQFHYNGAGGGSFTTTSVAGDLAFNVLGFDAFVRTFAGGDIPFDFTTTFGDPATNTVVNGANPNGDPASPDRTKVNFFASAGGDTTGNVLYLFFDDRGATNPAGNPDDDNHDDMVIKVTWASATTVPEPASLALFGAGLLGLGLARRRKAA